MVDKYKLSFSDLLNKLDELSNINIPKNYIEVKKKDAKNNSEKDSSNKNSK